jgi:RNA polymerase sigma-70 factor (ECF subfamily)
MQPFPGRRRRIRTAPRTASRLDYSMLGDAVLVRRAKDGDSDALAALCARHQPRVERLARRMLRDSEDARDAAQESLVRLCQKLDQFRGEAAFTTWLHRLVVNVCHDAQARAQARLTQPLEADTRVCDDASPAVLAELRELRDELAEGLAGLPEPQARVLVLKDALGLTFEEIALETGMPVGTAKCYAHRGRASLRTVLEQGV